MREQSGMTVRSNLQLLLAQVNVERAKRHEHPLSLRQLAMETGIAHSVLTTLAAGRSVRIDYATIDRVLTYINRYIPADTNHLIPWTPEQPSEHAQS